MDFSRAKKKDTGTVPDPGYYPVPLFFRSGPRQLLGGFDRGRLVGMGGQILAMQMRMSIMQRRKHRPVLGVMRRLRVQGLDRHRRRVFRWVGMAVVLRMVQGILDLPVLVMARKFADVVCSMDFVVVRCGFACKSW